MIAAFHIFLAWWMVELDYVWFHKYHTHDYDQA